MVRRFGREFGMCQQSENAEAVADGDGDDASARHAFAVVTGLRAVAGLEAAAEVVEKDGKALPSALGGGPYVEVQAILAHAIRAEVHISEQWQLHAACSELLGIPDAVPPGRGRRWREAQVFDRRVGGGHGTEDADAGWLGFLER